MKRKWVNYLKNEIPNTDCKDDKKQNKAKQKTLKTKWRKFRNQLTKT